MDNVIKVLGDILEAQDKQIKMIHKRHAQYQEDKNLKSYIEFWEKLWSNGGLLFESSKWWFTLPDLYIKDKNYNKALEIVKYIKKNKNLYYKSKSDIYIKKINDKIQK